MCYAKDGLGIVRLADDLHADGHILRRDTSGYAHDRERVHQSLDGDAPDEVSGDHPPLHAKFGNYSWISHCNGLFQTPIAA